VAGQKDRVRELESELEEALASIQRLRDENDHLRARLLNGRTESTEAPASDLMPPPADHGATIGRDSSESEKIALFRSLFRGRDDAYAHRWESRDGRSGYAPALRPGAQREKGQRPDPSVLLPFDDGVAQSHLTGQKVIGIYPLLEDETCWFLAIDFDKSTWQDDVREVLTTCEALGVPAALERSRSGRGGHVWIFFNSPVAAATARNLGCALLTRALDRRHQIGFDSYDRLFPNQDTMPRGGFGNLIALPLQRVARHAGNTEFLNTDFLPFPDQWKFLASIRRLHATDCERIVRDAAREGMILGIEASWFETEKQAREPWTLSPSRRRSDAVVMGPMPAAMEIVVANRVFIPKVDLPPAMLSRLRRLSVFQNPEFYRAQAMRLSTWDKPRVVDCSEDFPDHLALPRGTLAEVLKLLEMQGTFVNVKDERQSGTAVPLTFRGELTHDQRAAAEAIVAHDIGVLVAPTAFGKTVIGAWLIAQRGVNTLVLVHRQQLADQWRERLAAFLEIPARSIGQFGAGRNKGKGTIDIGMLQSLSSRGEVRDLVADYGHVLIDECHHVPAVSFERVLSEVRARYVTGLTATPTRKDGHEPILILQCGPIRHRVDARAQAEARPFEHVVIPRLTSFNLPVDAADLGIQEIYSRLVEDQARTEMIVTDVLQAVAAGRAPLVLTERTEHLERMQALLGPRVENLVVLRGGMGAGERKAVAAALRSIPDRSPRVLLATGRYIGEGFDDARLDTLFLALPVSWKGTIQQYAGRLHRQHERKRAVTIFDYVDVDVPMLARMHQKRLRGYAAIGYSVGTPPSRHPELPPDLVVT
jgi:superfamily II DNA or RNA helicase